MLMIVDTHVHLHDVFPVATFFDRARVNFARRADAVPGELRINVLCLVDTVGQNSTVRLCDEIRRAGAWQFAYSRQQREIAATHDDGTVMYLLAGRQIISSENIEVLALDTVMTHADRTASAGELIDRVTSAGGIPVLPWGFGKWTGDRGRVVEGLIISRNDFFLAENGNRWRHAAEHPLFGLARKRNIPILAGSDPLPFFSATDRAGACGIAGETAWEASSASEGFRALLATTSTWTCYGRGVSACEFLGHQLRMQIRKFVRRR
jgi:hypothetical protein